MTTLPSVVVILRGLDPDDVLSATDALREAGVGAVEVTLNSPNALTSLARLISTHPQYMVGAGTVRTVRHVRAVAELGARFVLSPHTDAELITATKNHGLLSIPGAFTPTEIEQAWNYGADVVKVFPVHTVGPAYLRAVREPLDNIPLLACGGLTAELGRACLAAGCHALGVGIGLLDQRAVRERDWPAVTRAARRYLEEIRG
nr:bifunctional 4-hydroxy-2-oxoglutarate aldolase/2-dehydro-3-deoxy-phosphogluconate aldolase [Kibdelosporangium sp. MJ126-NF4]CEL18122.1 4-Hydroxy-2-oxoglutarate aldolase @ 2-dehydro-3-deoxyphosphogluconate aldolase [Kibdelosporangium sp. MJ126-NF4]CTQ90649.1 4-Hydroxy-2-oxoglutarate aldolase (EC 4.1.3.16) @ 2-dehydro-3-deoxyphosphogluconate aldolase (EC 4.1.2.14) [Kibdelosporangium sp. MJ126-NF4]